MFTVKKTQIARLALATLAVALCDGAKAQTSGSASITLNGTAVPVCNLPNPATATTGTPVNATYSQNVVTVTQFIDPGTALVLPATLALQFDKAMCNSNATMSLTSKNSGMTQQSGSVIAAGSNSFLQTVPYTATATWAGVTITLNTAIGPTASSSVGGAISGPLTLTFLTQASTTPVVQGAYQDVVTLKLAATL
jgi:hypothetical protein